MHDSNTKVNGFLLSVLTKRAVPKSDIFQYFSKKSANFLTPTNSSAISFKNSYKNQISFDQIDIVKHFSFNNTEKDTHLSIITKNNINNSHKNVDKKKNVLRFNNEKFLEKIKEETNNTKKTIKTKSTLTNKESLIQLLELKMQNSDIKKRTLKINFGLKSKEYSNNSVENKDFYSKKSKIVTIIKGRTASINTSSLGPNKINFKNNSFKNFRQIYSSQDNKNSIALIDSQNKIKMNYNSNREKQLILEPKSKSIIVPELKNTIGDLKKFRYNSIKKKDIDKNLTQNIGNILKKVNKPQLNLDFKSFYKYVK